MILWFYVLFYHDNNTSISVKIRLKVILRIQFWFRDSGISLISGANSCGALSKLLQTCNTLISFEPCYFGIHIIILRYMGVTVMLMLISEILYIVHSILCSSDSENGSFNLKDFPVTDFYLTDFTHSCKSSSRTGSP